MRSFYVTTPIYYVNDVPHIGHAYTTILADVLARYHRLLGVRTHFLTGTDEHGQKVYEASRTEGITPKEQCDRTVVRFQDLWEKLGISNDDFIRTTEERHTAVVQEILQDLRDRGEIYRGEYEGWYSVTEERFYTEKDLVDGKTPDGNTVEKIVESNYFFRMGAHQEWLVEHIRANPGFIQPDFRRNETLGFLKKPLGDLCISRPKSRLPWGIELPWDRDYVCYVWFDALVNYISAIGYRRDDKRFGSLWPATCHLIGKDILTTHTVYWPTMLHAMGVEQPECIFAHGWWLMGEAKMSKSLGNVVDPMEMIDRFGADAFRYFLLAEMNVGQDASFSEELFVRRYNDDLANDLGNLASRILRMIARNCDGRVPEAGPPGDDERKLGAAALEAVTAVEEHLGSIALDRCMAAALGVVRAANRYVDRSKPWVLAKEGDTERLATVLYYGAECLRIVSGLLFPVMPEKMLELRAALGLCDDERMPDIERLRRFGGLPAGCTLGEVPTLFPRVQASSGKGGDPRRAKGKRDGAAAAGGSKGSGASPEPGAEESRIDISQFATIDLRTAKVVEASRVEGADKLLRLQLELGDERRQIVAGIAEYYDPAELVGRIIVIVANLKPAKIRGVESNGMLLAAKKGKKLRLVTTDDEIGSAASVG